MSQRKPALTIPPVRPAGSLLLVLVAVFLFRGAGARDRESVILEANAGLAAVDSLIQVDPGEAVGRARALMARFGDDPLYGWQVEGRLATALLVAGRPAEALPLLENLVRRAPHEAAGHRNLAAALRQLGRRGRALTEYGLVVELAPDDAAARLEYGQYLLEFRNWSLAEHHLLEARRLCGGCPEAEGALANLYLGQGNWAAAVVPLRRLADAGAGPKVERSLYAALARSGGDAELIARLEARGLPGLDEEQFRLLVDAEGRLGRVDHSRNFATGGGEWPRLPAEDGFWGQVALNLLAAGEWEAGLTAVDRAIALAPASVTHRTNRVVLLQELGREEEARREWEEVLRLDPGRADESKPQE